MGKEDLEAFRRSGARGSSAPSSISGPSVLRIYGSLRGAKEAKVVDTVAKPKPVAYYVIVGKGTAAILNHTTLRQTEFGKRRLSDPTDDRRTLPVMHVGFADPWESYYPHGMGQPPYLLPLPGYHSRPDETTPTLRHGTRSRSFAEINRLEWDLLKWKYRFEERDAWVAVIESRYKSAPPAVVKAIQKEGLKSPKAIEEKLAEPFDPSTGAAFRLLLIHPDEQLELVYAHKIDLCTGAGRARSGPAYPASARTQLWVPPDQWDMDLRERSVVTGQEALYEQTRHPEHQRILIYGGGGIAMNIVERSYETGNFLDWTPRGQLHEDPFDLPRNETVIRHPQEDRPLEPGDAAKLGLRKNGKLEKTYKIVPFSPSWRFGQYSELVSFEISGYHGTASFKSSPNAVMIDAFGQSCELDPFAGVHVFSYPYQKQHAWRFRGAVSAEYDRLVLSIGLPADELGQPKLLAGHFRFRPILENSRMVGLEAESGALRALGACATMYPGEPEFSGNAYLQTRSYFESLPLSAVLPGFIFSAANVAEANHYFSRAYDGAPHANVNTMTLTEIKDRLVDALGMRPLGDILKAADALFYGRRARNGFESKQALREALAKVEGLQYADQFNDDAARALDVGYPEPLPFWDE